MVIVCFYLFLRRKKSIHLLDYARSLSVDRLRQVRMQSAVLTTRTCADRVRARWVREEKVGSFVA